MPVERVDAQALDRAARGGVHQGVVAEVEEARDYGVEELVAATPAARRCIVVLDGIEDPHNVGAILRTVRRGGRDRRHPTGAPCRGARRRRRQGVGRRARHVRIATVVNIARALEELKAANVWTSGSPATARESYDRGRLDAADGARPRRRGTGLRRLVRETLRPAGVDPDAGHGREPERVGGRRCGTIRGGPSARATAGRPVELRQKRTAKSRRALTVGWTFAVAVGRALARMARHVLLILFCLGWRSSVR